MAIEHHTLSVNKPHSRIPHIVNSLQTTNYPKFQPSPRSLAVAAFSASHALNSKE
ncbi:hypothetical protein SADUNF_Sadunf10G0192600 [Salix dunnii]|uniref:Uncharacterized protein n=1 Tax=Salix dunnii TaxID=1413687 RepID=A0A835MSL3_9ROSI|nr:hypothetical protein SADUNF_Sadunf10G0192600 [Salix dunnii]